MNKLLQQLLGRVYREEADSGDGAGGSSGASGSGNNTDGSDKNSAGGNGSDNAGSGNDGDGSNKSGKKPTDEEARLLKEVMQKKEAANKAQSEANALREQLKRFEGIDPDAVRKMLDEKKASEEREMEAKGEWERLKQRMAEEHQKNVGSLQSRIQELEGELNKHKGTINELSIGTLFSQSKFISDELTLTPSKARVIYSDYFDLEDGKVVAYDKPKGAANRTAIVDSMGNAVGFDEAFRKIIEADPEKDHLLKSKLKPGAGSDSKPVSGNKPQKDSPADGLSKIAAGLKNLK